MIETLRTHTNRDRDQSGATLSNIAHAYLGRGDVIPGDHAHHDARHLTLLYGVLHILPKRILDTLQKVRKTNSKKIYTRTHTNRYFQAKRTLRGNNYARTTSIHPRSGCLILHPLPSAIKGISHNL